MPNWLYILVEWVIPLVMVPVVARGRRSFEAIAWLGFIFGIPWVGLPIYVVFGELGMGRNARKHARVRREVGAQADRHAFEAFAIAGRDPADHRSVCDVADRLHQLGLDGGNPVLRGNEAEIIENDDVIERLVADIDASAQHVHLLFFIFAPDTTGQRIADALLRAARRGVRCRVLVDAWASQAMLKRLAPTLRDGGIEVNGSLRLRLIRQPFRRLDVRNHRKIAVIDGVIAYTGSTNIHDPDFDLDEGVWHQVSARVTGPAVHPLQTLFLEDWYFAQDELLTEPGLFPPPEATGDCHLQVVADGPTYRSDAVQHLWIEMLNRAERSVLITTPYFVPDEPMLIALRLAALRGVEVDVVIPEKSDRRIADIAGRAYFGALLEVGARVHLHPSGIVHAKIACIDDRIGMLGTANLDRRSLFLNYEVVLLLLDQGSVVHLADAAKRLLGNAECLDPEEWSRRSSRERLVQDTAKLLSPVL